MSAFAQALIAWQQEHGRHDLPWQRTRDPYAIWLSEIMLQQTQVATVIPYYQRFRERFPDIASLAAADEDEVLRLWSGLGYYSRARNLHRAAQRIVVQHGGVFPVALADIEALPGIGRSTASAIAGFAYGARAAILDGNVKRVLTRHFGVGGFPGERAVEQRLWALAESLLPADGIEAYIQGSMDLGATICLPKRPVCNRCPVSGTCIAFTENRVHELPSPRPRKALPTRETAMAIYLHAGEVLLQKRPAVGIWGGLWCFPEAVDEEEVRRAGDRLYGCEVARTERLAVLKHSFTHFHLHITPVCAEVKRRLPRAAQPGVMWLRIEDALGGALPTPVKKILRALGGSTRGKQAALFEEAVEDL
ncbi:MAG TPA: A/G-specific adenine glycosylase [Burkholderiales bacterium]|nr:A/G-specific adenine glycosylase [Burkholderiales bacterium]